MKFKKHKQNKMGKLVLMLILSVQICSAQILINEYSVSNLTGFADNFGSNEDWIELYNTSSSPINLTGYRLSDKLANPGKWTFGNVTINANGFIRIWASGNNVNAGPDLHTNFSLKQCSGDKIIFSSPSLTILDSLSLVKTQANHSRGRVLNGSPSWSLFINPTPNASNNTATAYLGYALTPSMSIGAGFFNSNQNVGISYFGSGITLRYTLDGTAPTNTSTIYSAPISVATTSVIRAVAFSSNPLIMPSFIESNTYFINVTHSVNVISIFGDEISTLLAGTMINPEIGLEYFDEWGAFKTEGYGEANKHGNDSWAYDQRGIDFICKDEFGYADVLKHKIFNSKGRNKFQRIIIKAAANDNYPFAGGAHIRDSYVHTISQKASLHLDERTWVPGVLYVNGQYWGVYDYREKVDDKDFTKHYFDADKDSLQFLQTWGGTWSAYGGAQAQTDWTNLQNFIASNNMTVAANYNYASSYLSTKSLADYTILNSYVLCSDWLNWNTAWWRGLNYQCDKRKWRYTLWDQDATFGHYVNYTGIPSTEASASPCDPETLGDPGGQGHIPILNALLTNPTFKQYYVMRYFDLLNTGLSCTRMTQILDSMILKITPEMPRQIARWGGSMADWQQNVLNMRNFIVKRCDSVTKAFNNCYNVTGPFKVTVDVNPPGSGIIDFNSLTLTSFIWSGSYPGNLENYLVARPNPNYCFTHWTSSSGSLLPSSTTPSVSLILQNNENLVAHFAYNQTLAVVPASATICVGQQIQLSAVNGALYSWSPNVGLSCLTCPNPIATPSVSMVYSVGPSSCISHKEVTVTVVSSPTIDLLTNNSRLCAGKTFTTQISATGAQNYSWSPQNAINFLSPNLVIVSPTVSTTYTVIGSNSFGTLTCPPTQSSITINVVPQVTPGINNASMSICVGQKASFTAFGGTYYSWYPSTGLNNTSGASVISNAASSIVYTVNVGRDGFCSTTTTASLTVNSLPKLNAGVDTTYNKDEIIVINAIGTGSISWIAGEYIVCKDCQTTQVKPKRDACYIAEAIDEHGCKMTDEVCISITTNWAVYIPNSFTPNGDGLNDVFLIYGHSVLDVKMDIYDRWGTPIYKGVGGNGGWDGTYKNAECNVGVYNYKISYKSIDNRLHEKVGSVFLGR